MSRFVPGIFSQYDKEYDMNYDLLSFASKVRKVENMEQLKELKEQAEALIRREKNFALLTLMTVAEELGESEVTDSLERLRLLLEK